MSPALPSRPIQADEVEQKIESLLRAIDRGHRPAREAVEAVRSEFGRLPRTDGSIPRWRLADLDGAMQELVRRGLPPSSTRLPMPSQRISPERPDRTGDEIDLQKRFDALRRRVDALHDLVEAGRRPTGETFDQIHAALVAHRRQADCAEIRQMIDDVRGFRRAVLAASRPSTPARLGSSRIGRGFWGRPVAERPARLRRGPSSAQPRRSGHTQQPASDSAHALERAKLDAEARRLRDRAARFAAALPRGRVLPLRETERLFLSFKSLRPYLDGETQALNDAAVRLLVEAVTEVRARSRKP